MERRGLNIRKALLGTILPLLRKLPPRVASNMVAGIGRTEYTLLRGLRHRVDTAITQGSHHFGKDWDVRHLGRELAGNQIRWRTRDRLLDGLSDERVNPLFTVSGKEYLDSALDAGRGVVLLCNHFGSHMMPAHWLYRAGYPLRLFMERPRHISKFLTKQFDSEGPTGQKKLFISRKANPAEAAGSIMRASRVLNSGMILMIAGDVRWSGPQNSPAMFLGHRYTFSNTWIRLASMSGASVVRVFCRIEDDGSYQLQFHPPYTIPEGNPSAEEAARRVQDFLVAVEVQVGLHPANSNDYFFWSDRAEAVSAVS